MLRKLLILGICAGSSASIPILYQSNPEAVDHLLRSALRAGSRVRTYRAPSSTWCARSRRCRERMLGRKVQIQVGPHGHFTADFKLNGRKVGAIIDTGATLVAINVSTARRIGIALTPPDFKYTVNTANGKARAASAMIDRLQIGRIMHRGRQGRGARRLALSGTLIGASFLNRLAKYQVEDGALLLVQ